MTKLFFTLQVTGLFILCLAGTAAAQQCVKGDCVNGIGKYVYKNGDVYEGDFVKGKKEGSGNIVYAAGGKYIGEFKAGELHGYGIKTYDGGDVYQGDFVDGQKQGKGTYTFTNGDYYEGEYFKGERHGSGKLYKKETNTFKVGRWKDGTYIPDSAPAVQTTAKLSEGDLLKRQIAYVEDIEARLAKIKVLSQGYSTKLPPAQKRENLEARKSESASINALANKALAELGGQLTADSKQFFTTRQSESANNIKAYDAMLALVTMGEKDTKTTSAFLDKTLSTTTPTVIPASTTVAVSAASANPDNEGKELFEAVAANKIDLALELIKKGVNVHYRSWGNAPNVTGGYKFVGQNTLSIAALSKNLVLAKALLDAGADPNSKKNAYEETAFYSATQIEMPEMVELFLKYKADVRTRSQNDWTPLHNAANWNKGDSVVKLLLAAGADPNVYTSNGKTPLSLAQELPDKTMANTLFAVSNEEIRKNPIGANIPNSRLGANLTYPPPVYNIKPKAANAEELARTLWDAVKAQNKSEIIRLINAGAEVSWRLADTPTLKKAVEEHNIPIVQLLLEAGADPNLRDLQYGISPLLEAVSRHNLEMVKLLLRYKADPNLHTKDGRTALHMAAIFNGNDKITAVLIDAGANPNMIDASNRTAKSIAVGEKRMQIANLLDKALSQKTYAAGIRQGANETGGYALRDRNFTQEAAIKDYEIVHGRIHENMQRYINNYNKYARADPRLRSMMGGTVNTMNQAKDGALSMIDNLLKKHGNDLPKDLRDHLREDAGKFVSLPL